MKVQLIATIQGLKGEPAEVIAAAAGKGCYSALSSAKLLGTLEREGAIRFLKETAIGAGHGSILDFMAYVFSVEGINRRTSHQLVRHHVGITPLQQSQRYVVFEEGGFPFSTEPDWAQVGLLGEYQEHIRQTAELYRRALDAGIAAEVARDVLPSAALTNITMIVNARELSHICRERLCMRAQSEIRVLFWRVRNQVAKVSPEFARTLLPKCDRVHLGYCPEGRRKPDNLFCNRVLSKAEVFAAYDWAVEQGWWVGSQK